jgi:hypothetical protein
MEFERVVELNFRNASAGTGYLITTRHVLTARHVVDPEEKGAPCWVRPLCRAGDADTPLHARERPAAVPGRAAWLSKHADLAVVELTAGAPAAGAAEPSIPFGIVPFDTEGRRCDGVGFPEASGTADRRIEGIFNWVAAARRFDVNVSNGPPRKWDAWAGYSGTAVFCGGLPVAVICTVDRSWSGGVLEATPLQFLLEDADFLSYLATENVAPPMRQPVSRFSATILDRISAHIYRIDRGDPVAQITDHVRRLPSRTRPYVFAIPGLDEDEHHQLIKRLSKEPTIQKRLGRNAQCEDVIVSLPWPEERTLADPDARFRETLLDRLCNAARLPVPGARQELDPAVLRGRLDDGATPRAFWVLLKKADACAGHGQLLRRWLKLWRDVAAAGDGQPVLVFLCLAWDDPPPPPPPSALFRLFQSTPPTPDPEVEATLAAAIDAQEIRILEALTEIEVKHVHPWIDELPLLCRVRAPEQFEGLRNGLLARIGAGRRLRGVAADIDALLERSGLGAVAGVPR